MKKILIISIALVFGAGIANAATFHKIHHARHGHWASHQSADPSYGPGTSQFRYYQATGRCVIDEGYGRYSFCGNQ